MTVAVVTPLRAVREFCLNLQSGRLASQYVSMRERVLHGGVANAGAVVRSGAHVLRPGNPNSASIHQALAGLRRVGFTGASEPVGVDSDGRERLMFIEGDVPLPPYPAWAQADAALASMTHLIKGLHDSSRLVDLSGLSWSNEMADPEGGPVLCHNDVCLGDPELGASPGVLRAVPGVGELRRQLQRAVGAAGEPTSS